MEGFLAIIVLVFGALQIILFFKIWGMTNNVKKLTEHFLCNSDYENIGDNIRLAKMRGRTKEQIQQYLAENMANDIMRTYSSQYFDMERAIRKWEQIFNNAGVEIPDYLEQIKTSEDVIKLYHEKEWEDVLNG